MEKCLCVLLAGSGQAGLIQRHRIKAEFKEDSRRLPDLKNERDEREEAQFLSDQAGRWCQPMRGGHLKVSSVKVGPGQSSSSHDWFPGNAHKSAVSVQQAPLQEERFCLRNIFISYNKDAAERSAEHRPELSPLMWVGGEREIPA